MSNYNSQLQSNNTDLQLVLQTLQNKVAGGGNTNMEDDFITRTLSTYTNSRVSSIENYAFAYATNLKSVDFPNVKTIGNSAFNYCTSLTTASFPACTTISNGTFSSCYELATISFPVCTTIGSGAFYDCSNLTIASFPACTSIGSNAFYDCSNLITASFPICTTINNAAFRVCCELTTANFSTCTTIYGYAFFSCSKLTTASFPTCTTIYGYAFGNCISLTTVSFPVCTSIGSSAFYNCPNLTTASFPACTTIGSLAFRYCYNLKSLFLMGSSLCILQYSNVFNSTPIGGYSASAGTYGSIYVPASLLTSYQNATNWAYFSSRFVAYDNEANIITFTIDGTEYQAEEGMTWGVWIYSEYNTDGYRLANTGDEICTSYGIIVCNNETDSDSVNINDTIVNNGNYNYGLSENPFD